MPLPSFTPRIWTFTGLEVLAKILKERTCCQKQVYKQPPTLSSIIRCFSGQSSAPKVTPFPGQLLIPTPVY